MGASYPFAVAGLMGRVRLPTLWESVV